MATTSSKHHRTTQSSIQAGQADVLLSLYDTPVSATLLLQRKKAKMIFRISVLSLVLALSVIWTANKNPSPWISDQLPLFLRFPLSFTSDMQSYTGGDVSGRVVDQSRLSSSLERPSNRVHAPGISRNIVPQHCQDPQLTSLQPRENGVILLLVRGDSDIAELLPTLINFEERFNQKFRYPYLFISNPVIEEDHGLGEATEGGELSTKFREAVDSVLPRDAKREYSIVPPHHWSIPSFLSKIEIRRGFIRQGEEGVQYSSREGYHHMIRWYSGLFARHPSLVAYDWYWRLEPGVTFYCDVTYDPFRFMSMEGKVYGFVISIVENENTIPTLWQTINRYKTRERIVPPSKDFWRFFAKPRPVLNQMGNTLREQRGGERESDQYSLCHFWTNFEIGDLRFFRSDAYQNLFEELDQAGGFYTERWGDAPVRSIALGLLADIDQIHYFQDFGYRHDWFMHCPHNDGPLRRSGIGCNCQCPRFDKDHVDIDNDWRYTCLDQWKEALGQSGTQTLAYGQQETEGDR